MNLVLHHEATWFVVRATGNHFLFGQQKPYAQADKAFGKGHYQR